VRLDATLGDTPERGAVRYVHESVGRIERHEEEVLATRLVAVYWYEKRNRAVAARRDFDIDPCYGAGQTTY